jgi:APA family basic amino acid/polyamine antiporter
MKSKSQQVGLLGAISIGLASMLGAGVFVVFGQAYQIAGEWLFVALFLAGLVAALNASSIYQLAKQVDRPGGTYSYARVYRNKTLSFVAGFAFVFGKIGSIAAIALALGAYVSPQNKQVVAIAAVVVMVTVNTLGIQRTGAVAAVLATITTGFLIVTSVLGLTSFESAANQQLHMSSTPTQDIAMAASVLFFAFAGYARIATLGNEVKNPKRNIPLAIALTLTLVLFLYLALTVVLLAFLGDDLIGAEAPFVQLFSLLNSPLSFGITIVAVVASLGSILALLAGVSRTAATMAEDKELPKVFEHRNRFGSPWLAELVIAVGAIVLVEVGDLTAVIGFSSFSVLLYYAIAHISALGQPKEERIIPRWLAWLGMTLCIWLALATPGNAAEISALIILLALVIRSALKRKR